MPISCIVMKTLSSHFSLQLDYSQNSFIKVFFLFHSFLCIIRLLLRGSEREPLAHQDAPLVHFLWEVCKSVLSTVGSPVTREEVGNLSLWCKYWESAALCTWGSTSRSSAVVMWRASWQGGITNWSGNYFAQDRRALQRAYKPQGAEPELVELWWILNTPAMDYSSFYRSVYAFANVSLADSNKERQKKLCSSGHQNLYIFSLV